MDIIQLLEDYQIPTASAEHKHSRPGWVNVECPFHFTEHPGYHLGFTLDGKIAYCWSCGLHFIDQSIAKLLHISISEARNVMNNYTGFSHAKIADAPVKIGLKSFKLPGNVSPLLPSHIKYLEKKRNFDSDKLKKEWGLLSTGPVSFLDKTDYGHRILAPIYWEDRIVTFQGRDVTGAHPMKYLACPKAREIIHHKHLIYRHKEAHNKVGIATEGITDVWRFGRKAFATFGIEFTPKQVRLISKLYTRVGVCFDDEPQAVRQANELIGELRFRGVDAFRIDIVGDPGGLSQEEANYIVKQIK